MNPKMMPSTPGICKPQKQGTMPTRLSTIEATAMPELPCGVIG